MFIVNICGTIAGQRLTSWVMTSYSHVCVTLIDKCCINMCSSVLPCPPCNEKPNKLAIVNIKLIVNNKNQQSHEVCKL